LALDNGWDFRIRMQLYVPQLPMLLHAYGDFEQVDYMLRRIDSVFSAVSDTVLSWSYVEKRKA